MSLTKILDALDPVFQRTLGATFPAAGVVVPRATSIEYMLGDRRATAAAPRSPSRCVGYALIFSPAGPRGCPRRIWHGAAVFAAIWRHTPPHTRSAICGHLPSAAFWVGQNDTGQIDHDLCDGRFAQNGTSAG